MHLISLHEHGSNNPEGIRSATDRLRFHPYFTSKDLIGFLWMFILISLFIYWAPNY
jgi:ubiquinol-cytochrome c reductase cytochrome b subunit